MPGITELEQALLNMLGGIYPDCDLKGTTAVPLSFSRLPRLTFEGDAAVQQED